MQALVSLVLLLAGGFFTWELLVGPTVDVIRSTSWVKTPCRIVESGVASSEATGPERPFPDRLLMLHSLEMSFRYEVDGQVHVGRRYSFAKDVRTSGSRHARKIVALYPSGREATCWVNPKDPTEAVVNRRFQGSTLLGLAPFLLFLVGFFGLTGRLFGGSGESRRRFRWRAKTAEGAPVRPLGEHWVNGQIAAVGFAGLARVVDDPGAGHARRTAAETLGKIGPLAREALPSLFRFHASSDPDTRGAVLIALASIAPDSADVVDLLAKATADPDTVGSAYLAFREVGPRGAPAVPRLVDLLASPDAETRERAFDALGAIGPGASAALPALRELARNPGPGPEGAELATAASEAIRKIETPAAEAAGALPAPSPTALAPPSR